MSRSRRQRPVIVLLLTACLLLQQLAMSALACTMPLATTGSASPAQSMAMAMSMATTADMAPDCHATMAAEHPAPIPDGVCEKHCSPDATSASTPDIPPVPALALPPLLHPLVLAHAPRGCESGAATLFTRSDPPRLRYCRLLI